MLIKPNHRCITELGCNVILNTLMCVTCKQLETLHTVFHTNR